MTASRLVFVAVFAGFIFLSTSTYSAYNKCPKGCEVRKTKDECKGTYCSSSGMNMPCRWVQVNYIYPHGSCEPI